MTVGLVGAASSMIDLDDRCSATLGVSGSLVLGDPDPGATALVTVTRPTSEISRTRLVTTAERRIETV